MKVSRYMLITAALIGCMMACGFRAEAAEGCPSPVAVAVDTGGTAYVAEHGCNRIACISVSETAVARHIALPFAPTGLTLSPKGERLYVTGGEAPGKLAVVDVATGNVAATYEAGHSPMAPVVSPDGATVYVCNRFENAVLAFNAADGKVLASVPMLREPVAAAVTPDGSKLVVANHLPTGASDGAFVASSVAIMDTAVNKVTGIIPLFNGATGLRGVCLSPDGRFAYVTHILARYHLPTTQLERGWMNTNAVSVIDVAGAKLVNSVLLDQPELGAANPWGVACSDDGAYLCVALSGTHELEIIDRTALHDRLVRAAAGEQVNEVTSSAEHVSLDLSFLTGIRRRVSIAGNGPRALAVSGTTAIAAEYFTDAVSILDIAPAPRTDVKTVALAKAGAPSQERLGERLFNDANLCFQKWQSCASCHPDGRADGLNWDLLNDGMGNHKNTKSLLLSHDTPPAMVSGVRGTAEVAVRAGIRHILFASCSEEDAKAMDAYLIAMRPVPSPVASDPASAESVKHGKAVFDKAGCALCHSGDLFTNLEAYDVGTGKRTETEMEFDTPTLCETWRTGPYLHDGRSADLEAVLTAHNAGDKHGTTSDLTEQEIADLVAFVASL